MPVFLASPPDDPIGPWVELLIQGQANLLSATDAGNTASGSVGTWTGTNCALAQTGSAASDGSFPIRLTASSAADMSATSGNNAVVAGNAYSGLVAFMAGSTGRSTQAKLVWKNAGGGTISTSLGSLSSDSAGSYAAATVSDYAPTGAVNVELVGRVVAAGNAEVHYMASRGVFPGVVSTWSEGGQAGVEKATVQFSDDGSTWATVAYNSLPVTLSTTSQQATVTDWTPFPNTTRQYRTQTTDSNGKVSAWSTPIAATVSPDRLWLVDVTNPDAGGRVPLRRIKGGSGGSSGLPTAMVWGVHEAQAINYGLDDEFPVIQRGKVQGMTTTLTCYVEGQSDKNTLVNLRNRQQTLLLQGDGVGEHWFVSIGADVGIEQVSDPSELRHSFPRWVVTLSLTETAAP